MVHKTASIRKAVKEQNPETATPTDELCNRPGPGISPQHDPKNDLHSRS